MRRMAGRGLVVLLLLAGASAAVLAQAPVGGPAYPTERETSCWDCHSGASYGDSPPLSSFVTVTPPATAGAALGVPFDYPVRVQNAWTADLTYVEPRLDLAAAPSLAFAADADPLHLDLAGTLQVDFARLTEDQVASETVEVPVGLTQLLVRLVPDDRSATGPDLALRVEAGAVVRTFDRAGRGGVEELDLTERSQFSEYGYGNWTVSAVHKPLRPDASLLNASVPRSSIPFRLVLDGEAKDTGERLLGLPSHDLLARAQGRVALFRLVALQVPAAGELVALDVLAHVHYKHPPAAGAKDDADLAKTLDPAIRVAAAPDGGVVLSAASGPVAQPVVHNGATMATVAEAVGYASAFLLVASSGAGGLFGKTSRRWANGLFGSARRRVAFHNFLSYGLILAALAHTTLFLVEAAYAWAIGLLWGGAAALCMLGLGVTGALQVAIIRRWSFRAWRWAHYGLALGTFAFTLAHVALDGTHFAAVQDALGWRDPVASGLAAVRHAASHLLPAFP